MSLPPADSERSSGADQARWFAAEVQPHEPALRAYLHRHFPGLSDADDVVQESFLKALIARQMGKIVSAKGFLFTVARHAAVSFFRKRKFLADTPVGEHGEWPVLADDVDTVEAICTQDEIGQITQAIASLPERCREVVTLRLMQGLDYAEIARTLGISEPTVRVQVARGMRKCCQFLRERGINPDSP